MIRNLVIFALLFVLSGCTSVSEVIPIEKNTYRVSAEIMGGGPKWSDVKDLARIKANDYCAANKKYVKEIDWETHGSSGWTALNAELKFSCVDANAAGQTQAVIPNEAEDDRYDELRELKSLLDEGVISQEEYDQEKKEILDQ